MKFIKYIINVLFNLLIINMVDHLIQLYIMMNDFAFKFISICYHQQIFILLTIYLLKYNINIIRKYQYQ